MDCYEPSSLYRVTDFSYRGEKEDGNSEGLNFLLMASKFRLFFCGLYIRTRHSHQSSAT